MVRDGLRGEKRKRHNRRQLEFVGFVNRDQYRDQNQVEERLDHRKKAGIVDRFRAEGLRIAGPTKAAAQLESSKVFTKKFLAEQGIPTAAFEVHHTADSAEDAIRSGAFDYPVVLKADGLAAGKGVLICHGESEALQAIATVMRERKFGAAGAQLVIEEYLTGEETSFMVFTDGRNILPMVPSQDHKAAYEADEGPNTGGMGAYSVDFLLDDRLRETIIREIIEPTVLGMEDLGEPFQGVTSNGALRSPCASWWPQRAIPVPTRPAMRSPASPWPKKTLKPSSSTRERACARERS
ncbi:MAG: hypothetical protein P8Y94_06075 [Acidobacteriota bacterium]